MPSVDLYLDPADGELLLDWLNSSVEVAFVLGGDRGAPRLAAGLPSLPSGNYFLFHDSYPSIPTHASPSEEERAVSEDVYSRMKIDAPQPLSGPDGGHPAIFEVCIRYDQRQDGREVIGLSHVAWIGDRYAGLGVAATPESKRWWRRFNAWVGRTARKISRSGPLDDYPKNLWAWAFPSALTSIESGVARADNPPAC